MVTESIQGSYYRQTIIRNTNTHVPVIAIDFDGTIVDDYFSTNDWYAKGAGLPLPPMLEEIVPIIKALYRMGYRFILWTCRCGVDLNIAKKLLEVAGVIDMFDAFNENVSDLPFPTSNKICADFYVDDCGFNTSKRELIAVNIFWEIVKRSKPTEHYTATKVLAEELRKSMEVGNVSEEKAPTKRKHGGSYKDEVQRKQGRGKRQRGNGKSNNNSVSAEEECED